MTLLETGYDKLLHYFLMRLKTEVQMGSILNILKVAHDKFTWNDLQISCIGIYGGRFGKTGFKDFGCTSSIPAQYR